MIQLRRATEADLSIIQDLARITWQPTYVPIIGQEQVDYMLKTMYNPGVLLGQLGEGHIFLIASTGMKDIGFAAYSIVDHENRGYKLHKLYVLPDAHGTGLGKLLINEVVDQIRTAGGKSLSLNVNRQNKAKTFYEKAGFEIKETVDIEIGNGFLMNDYIMEMPIGPA
jgi:ribosomal protein S18 acetylase RimI-like enzyme